MERPNVQEEPFSQGAESHLHNQEASEEAAQDEELSCSWCLLRPEAKLARHCHRQKHRGPEAGPLMEAVILAIHERLHLAPGASLPRPPEPAAEHQAKDWASPEAVQRLQLRLDNSPNDPPAQSCCP